MSSATVGKVVVPAGLGNSVAGAAVRAFTGFALNRSFSRDNAPNATAAIAKARSRA